MRISDWSSDVLLFRSPRLQHIEFADQHVILHLAEPAAPPPGWSGTDEAWTFELDQPLPDPESPAPWPLLCTIGATDDGHLVLAKIGRASCRESVCQYV